MSSVADSLKQPADATATADEPNPKKAKVADNQESVGLKAADAKNVTTATEKPINLDNNNGNGSKTNNKIPSKAANGNVKSDGNAGEVDEFNEDDDDCEGSAVGVFDPKIANALEQVETIQLEISNLNEKASEEILKVEQKFNKLRRPHFEKRNELLKEIPNFWLTSLANHSSIAPMIDSAEDEDCLHYMVNLDVEEFEDIKSGYKLKLHFVENPYITNSVIEKEFRIVSTDHGTEMDSKTNPIEYKNTEQGQKLKQIVESSIAQYRENIRSRRTGQLQQSFFAWLAGPTDAESDGIAEILKDQIWPNPLEFFFASPEDEYGGVDGSDDDSEDEDEEIDDEEIDEEEDGGMTGDNIDFSDEELEGEDGEDGEDDEEDVE